ncbi:MAG: DUF4386 domain-containing protein [Ornithinimicrobium sp.]
MSTPPSSPTAQPPPISIPGIPGPPSKHQLALMIWLAVFPTLTVLNLVLGDWLGTRSQVMRTFVLATIAVPIVIYGLMPQLHRLRGQVLTRITPPTKKSVTVSGRRGLNALTSTVTGKLRLILKRLREPSLATSPQPDLTRGQGARARHTYGPRRVSRTNQSKEKAMSRRMIAVIVGILFIVQMVTAIIGTSLIQAFVDGDTARAPMAVGVLFMMCAGLAVVGIGLLMYPVLKAVDQRLAIWYPILRITEFTVSTVIGVYLLTQLQVVPNHMLWVYIPTGLGGLVLTYLLYVSRLVPRPIAVLGLVGYALLAVGVPFDLLGVLDMNEGPGQVLLAPGGLFEALALPIWLIAKGFNSPSSQRELKPHRLVTT